LYWSSPFELGTAVQDRLAAAGVQRMAGPEDQVPPDALLVYVSPQSLLAAPTGLAEFLAGYQVLLSRGAGQRLIADWRLLALDPEAIAGWLKGDHPCAPATATPPDPSGPLQALLLNGLLQAAPELLDAYLDLELQAELAQTPVDSSYDQRSRACGGADQLLDSWRLQQHQLAERQSRIGALEQELQQRGEAVAAAQAAGQAATEQLQQLQGELEQLRQQVSERSQQLAGKRQHG
jgi:hypothetical protein